MDRDTVRAILLVIGGLVIAGIYLWGRYKERLLNFLRRWEEFDELGLDSSAPAATPEGAPSGGHGRPNRKEPSFSPCALDQEDLQRDPPVSEPAVRASEPERGGQLGAPFLIQLSVVAGQGRMFQGEELRDALEDLNLEHGEMGIFHRYDPRLREPLFSVASLVEPGTFPIDDMASFHCPGVVLFFQPATVANPLAVYDDLVRTCHRLADRLDGIEWDETRRPLTPEKLAQLRALLEDACAASP